MGQEMKDGVREIVGKSVSGVIVAKNDQGEPHVQVFLTFSDGTYFEFWGENFSCAGGVMRGDKSAVATYLESLGAAITKTFPAS